MGVVPAQEAAHQREHLLGSLPVLILYPHSRCNCRCVMCDIWKITTANEISAEALQQHLGDIEKLGVEWVVFSGGEPLMHSDLFRLARLLRDRGVRTTILTTGLLLERDAERIPGALDDMIVSLDGPPPVHNTIRRVPNAFEKLATGVRALHAFRPEFPVAARVTVQRLNHLHLRETVNTAKKLALESVSFLAADVASTAFNRPEGWGADKQAEVALNATEVEALAAEIESLIREHKEEIERGFVRENPDKLRGIADHFRCQLGQKEPAAPRCNAPWVSAVVETDGTVRPCFFHRPIGRLQLQNGGAGQTLGEIINGEEALAFRQSLNMAENPTCKRCVCSLYWPRRTEDY